MAQECGFFNAQLVGEEYDRVYLAEQFAAYFASFIGNGVFGSSMQQLKVLAQDTANMSVKVGSGQAWINGWWYRNTDTYTLDIDVADGALSRIDLIVLRWGQTERDMWLQVIKGKPSANPVAPSISRGADYYDLQLATVSIHAGAIKITQAQITDTRLDNSVCGLVTGVVDQIDTTSLFSQFMTAYQEWKDNQQADYEDWTDVQKEAYNQFVSDTEGDYTDYTTGKQEEFNTWYTTYLTAFQTAVEAWFENIKGQFSEDSAIRIQLELDEHEDVLNDIQHMVIHNDYYCPIELSDGSILATNNDKAILMDWSYVEAPCTRSNVGGGSQVLTDDLETAITNANAAKASLKNATTTANGVYQSLQAENAAAKSNIAELQDENFNSQEILAGVADLRAYLGLYDSDVVGVQVDYKNKTYKRLGAASGLNGGSDFDQFPMFGGRKRCNVANDGTINAWYGDSAYKEDGSNGQVMVYQPAFWYLVAPVEYEKQATGVGYHLRKANYYVSGKARAGFRLHPAFYDANGNEVDHIFFSAFCGSIYDTSAKSYIKDDAQVCDAGTDLFCSISGVKPASGYNQNLTRTSIEQMAQNRGAGWHGDTIKATSANQLLMLIEYAGNLQTAIERGVVDIPWTGLASDNASSYAVNTGGTSGLGNATGHADSSTQQINGQTLTNTTNGKRSISYRGMEDPWGNMWDFVYGVNIYGNGKMNGGQLYICKNFNFAESKNSDNYEAAGFCITDKAGYVSAMGYSTTCDWLFVASECKGDSSLPIGDYTSITENLNGYRIVQLGGNWSGGNAAGGFYWYLDGGVGTSNRAVSGRLVFVPTATAA